MTFDVLITDPAREEFDGAFEWLVRQSPQHAPLWYNGILEAILSLSENPARWPLAQEPEANHRGIRQLLYGDKHHAYRIFFQFAGRR